MAELRTSQRVPLRCTECAQRRIKCDKKIPCRRCIANRCAHLCVREVVRVRGKPTVPSARAPIEDANASLARQNSRLQERVAELELALTLSLRGRAGAQRFSVGNGSPSNDRPMPTAGHQATAFEEVGAILDEWNLGRLKQEKLGKPTSENDLHFLVETLKSVPDSSTSTRIVEFSLQMLGWIH
ncbi:uncharacterized protein N7498_009111 [Penicillium cinerascens]|uniref:Zn(2)-C6 fungal-type domain-containing protein n=1 Tax=Penicillium cinerascens TaxID=70096 RepID=A0A9W9J9F4_9EURO|nr:uncharacterized protein N7498_009111 [Penicillium cinerascens]KAJ5190126.1 hypothetical protein N7498_009111 [Penicillium cinerascens]